MYSDNPSQQSDYLTHALHTIIGRLQNSDALNQVPVEDFTPYQPLLNHHLVLGAFISVDKTPYLRFNNDQATRFFGRENPDVTAENIGFYYRIMKLSQMPLMIHAHQFFTRKDPGEFRCRVSLKDHTGTFHEMTSTTKTVAWDSRGRPAYAVTISVPVIDYEWCRAYESFDFQKLPSRSQEAGRLLFQGHSNQEIADSLGVSVKSIEKDLHQVFERAHTNNRGELFKKLAHT
ncbi:MAG: LuxR C-terminal-related transcriptional regulator [Verrucomicrobiota bacterium]